MIMAAIPDSTIAALIAMRAGKATPMARVLHNDFGLIGRLLDEGMMGIIVPMVNDFADLPYTVADRPIAEVVRYDAPGRAVIFVIDHEARPRTGAEWLMCSRRRHPNGVRVVSREGIEPSTRRLRVCCSAN